MASESYRVWWSTDSDAKGVGYNDGAVVWDACKTAMLEKINDENFLEGFTSRAFVGQPTVSLIAEEMRKVVNEL